MRNIHPNQVDCKVICDKCHSFYTGKQQAKRTGTVEKFNKKFGLNQENK